MIDEWNNDCPYDFKNIQFYGDWGYWAYTFNWINDESDNSCEDLSVKQYVHPNDEGGYTHTYGNVIKPCEFAEDCNYGVPFKLNACVFLNTASFDGGNFYGCYSNTFGNDCYSNTFGNYCYCNSFEYGCGYNSFGDNCYGNSFGNNCSYIKFASNSSASSKYNYYQNNYFGDGCEYILFKASETASSAFQVQNYKFAQGLRGTSDNYLIVEGKRNRAYETKVAKNSKGEVKVYCEAD